MKSRFCPRLHVWPGDKLLRPRKGTERVLTLRLDKLWGAQSHHLELSHQARGWEQPVVWMGS